MAIPSDLSGLRLWHKADAITGLVDGDPLASGWVDSSGNGFTSSQGTAGKRPIYKTGISPTGLPVVRFDGVDDQLTGTTMANLMNVTFGVYTAIATVYVTASGTGANSWLQPAVIADSGAFIGMHVRDLAGTPQFRVYNWDTTEDFAEVAVTYNSWLRLALDHDNTTLNGFTDTMVSSATSTASGATDVGAANIRMGQGTGAYLTCDFGELCVWNRVLTGTERQDMAAYLARWTTAVGPPPAVLAGRLIGEVI